MNNERIQRFARQLTLPGVAAALAFVVLFAQPIAGLLRDWWTDPDAQQGLLLAPIAGYLIYKAGRDPRSRPQPSLGVGVLVLAVILRYLSGLAAERFTMVLSAFGAAAGLVIFTMGLRQLLRWWLPITLLLLSVPIPTVLLNSLAFPLQLKASQMGAVLLKWRHVPVLLAGNVLHLPGQTLFVTEACSGLRSLTALVALGLLIGGLWLRTAPARALLVLAAIPVAMFLNGVRIFLTGFLVYFVDPALGEGVMHYSEGWVIFVVAFAILGVVAWAAAAAERRFLARRAG